MNIGYLVKFKWYPPSGGATVHAYQLARHLSQRGHQLKTIFYWHEAPGLEVYRQRQLLKFVRDIDVLYIRVHGEWSFEHLTLLKALRCFKLPVIWEVNSPLEELIARDRYSPGQVRTMMMKRRFFSQMTDAAICVSSVMKDYADTALKIRNTYVVPNGSDPEQFSPLKRDEGLYGENRNCFKVLWSGSADYPWQGVELVLKVAERVYEMDKEVKFILITNPAHLSNQRLFYKNVVLIGQKPYLDIASYIASADAGLCLYQDYGWNGRFYFSPLKLFDYMSSGLPVIASAWGQITEAIQDQVSGILTDNDIEDIAQKIVRLKRNRQEAKQLGVRARAKVVEYYNWERAAQQTESILKEFVKQ